MMADATQVRAGDVIADRHTITFLPVGTEIRDASGRRCEMRGSEGAPGDWMSGGWPTIPALPATVVRTLHRIYSPFHDGTPDQYALEIDVYTSTNDEFGPGPTAMADTPTATFAVDSAWLRQSAAILSEAADSIDNLIASVPKIGDRVRIRSTRIAGFAGGVNEGTVVDSDTSGRYSVHVQHPGGDAYYTELEASELERVR